MTSRTGGVFYSGFMVNNSQHIRRDKPIVMSIFLPVRWEAIFTFSTIKHSNLNMMDDIPVIFTITEDTRECLNMVPGVRMAESVNYIASCLLKQL